MEGFSYVDIYATKGIEYLIVIGFLFAVMLFWRYLWIPGREIAEEMVPLDIVEWFRVPEGYYYHQGHSWMRKEEEDLVTVGLDDFAQKFVGRTDSFWLPEAGSKLSQGDIGWSFSVDKKFIDMLSPVDGEVVEVNREVADFPEIVNQDPYGRGWLMKVRASKLPSNTRNLLSGNTAKSWMEGIVDNLRMIIGGKLGPVYHDGGLPVSGIARALNGEGWHELVEEFFLTKGEL
jgi:glycine cleavage system H lipoate-binding protein